MHLIVNKIVFSNVPAKKKWSTLYGNVRMCGHCQDQLCSNAPAISIDEDDILDSI